MKVIDEVLLEYLAPEAAHAAAARIAAAVQSLIAGALAAPPQVKAAAPRAAAPVAAAAAATAPAPRGRRGAKKKKTARKAAAVRAIDPNAEADEEGGGVTAAGRVTMRFKRKVYWAKRRAELGEAPLPGDAEVIAADEAGRVLNIDKWAKPKARANGKQPTTTVAADAAF
jgi:hypothetical protein